MNVTGVEWRDLDPHENRYDFGKRRRRAPDPARDQAEDDSIELHGQDEDEPADGLDEFE